SKKSRAGSPGPQSSAPSEQPRRDAVDVTLFCSPSSSSSSSSTLTPTSAGLQDPSASCPGTPSAQHNKLGMMQGVGCPSPVATLKRPTALSRHASAAESQRPVAHECLGEVLRILRQVINTYPLLNTVEILTAAGKLISKVKFHYESSNEADKKDFEKAIETIAVAFSSVSELLMGEVDSSTLLSLLPTEKSR
uniref:Rho GTPase-activating protein 29/45 N-terminal domain-containing protein n=1 Tax=Neolamprologus brichardi TaxID=32507 RepID=A0A3Q4I7L6_NEOBR